jgi:hypothetical protein
VILIFNLVALAVYATLIYALAPYGVNVVAAGVAGFGVLSVLAVQAFVRRPYAGLTFRDLWSEISAGVVTGAVVFVSAVLVRIALEQLDLPPIVVLSLVGGACLVMYAVTLRTLFRAAWLDLGSIVRSASRRNA